MSEVDFPPSEAELNLLRAELVALRAENTGLRVKLAELTTDKMWLKRVLMVLFTVVLVLTAALVLERRPGERKPDDIKPNGTSPGALNRVFRLLKNLFEEDEVARFIHLNFGPAGEAIVQGLSQPASTDDLFFKIALALMHHGLAGDIFFDALLEVRPHRRDDILRVRAACGDQVADSP